MNNELTTIQATANYEMRDGSFAIIAGRWYTVNKIGYAFVNVIDEKGTGQHIFSGKEFYDTFDRFNLRNATDTTGLKEWSEVGTYADVDTANEIAKQHNDFFKQTRQFQMVALVKGTKVISYQKL